MANKRIYNLNAATDTQGKGMIADVSGDPEAKFTPVTYHTVSSLPLTPLTSVMYQLSTTDGLAPKGIYTYTNGWGCIEQLEEITLSWSGIVDIDLYTGVDYIVNVDGNVTSLILNMTSDGDCRLLLNNLDRFDIVDPSDNIIFETGDTGLDALSGSSVRMIIQRDTVGLDIEYEISTQSRVAPTITEYMLIAYGDAYLDLGFTIPDADAGVYLEGAFDTYGTSEMMLMGIQTTGSYTYLGNQSFGSAYSIWCTDSDDGFLGTSNDQWHIWERNQDGLVYDNLIESAAGTFTDCLSLNVFLFANNNDGTPESLAEGRIHTFVIYDTLSASLYMQLIPVPQGSTTFSIIPAPSNCMWDTVSKRYIEASGVGTFGIAEFNYLDFEV
jgi:hypothetical protein